MSSSSATLFRSDSDVFSAKTKLFIKPTIPFEISFNGKSEQINFLTIYQPSPIRIENVQHDAMIGLGDPSVGNKLIVLIPVIASPTSSDASDFIGKIATYGATIVNPEPTTAPATAPETSVSAATGADWNLTKLIPVGQNSIASGAFFTWNSATYTQQVARDSALFRTFRWRATPGPQYVLMAEPVAINPVDLEVIRRLPVTEPASAIHSIGVVSYKSAPPRECKNCPRPAFPFTKKGSPGASPAEVTAILISVAAFIIGLYAISVGLKWAVGSELLKNWSDSFMSIFPKKEPVAVLRARGKSPFTAPTAQ